MKETGLKQTSELTVTDTVTAVVRTLLAFLFLILASTTNAQGQKKVLWLGTSIPEGCTYPRVACEQNGMICINKSVGSSFLCQWTDDLTFHDYASGLSLTMTASEKESMFRKYVDNGTISEERLNFWKSTSYETLLLPYVKDVDVIVIDHGFNTPDHNSTEKHYLEGEENIDWDTNDRTDFVGAFNFIYNIIKSNNPNALVIIGGYFQNSCTIGYFKRGLWASNMLESIALHYQLPLLDVWNYTDIPDGYMPHSQDYLAELNAQYNTSFEKVYPDDEGNITYFQTFCPDGVHPFSDPTGNSDEVLNQIFTNMLANIVNTTDMPPTVNHRQAMNVKHYNIEGKVAKPHAKGLHIVRSMQDIRKYIVKD